MPEHFEVAVIGGGPSGATAARTLASLGRKVIMVDPENRIKPCGGAIPSVAMRTFNIPDYLLKARRQWRKNNLAFGQNRCNEYR